MKRPELLAPAGSPEVLKIAIRYGADAVYLGGEAYGLRAGAANFTREEMADGIAYAHAHGAKVYVTANIFAHETDLSGVRDYFADLRELKPDALLIADPGVFALAKEICPEIPRHISTQANNTNSASCRFWHAQGAERIVAARELSLFEIGQIREAMPESMSLEAFVHGAMCISYSGRCLISNCLTGRDANQGACTHPCRWKYALVEETRPGEYFPIDETERGSYLMNSKDLCMVDHIPELIEAGIDSFKIEGRMKTALYVATITRAYRMAIDDYLADAARYEARKDAYLAEVTKGTNRGFTTGFFFGKPGADEQIYDRQTYQTSHRYIGTVERINDRGFAVITQKNKFVKGDQIEVMKADGRNLACLVEAIYDAKGAEIEAAPHPKEELHLKLDVGIEPLDILRQEVLDSAAIS